MRGDGLRVQMQAIEGVTKGRTATLLSPYFRFQCPPLDSFQHDHGHAFNRSSNYQGVERIRRGGRRLVSIPMRTIIVEYAQFVTEQNWDVPAMTDLFELISEEGYAFRLLATHKYGDKAEVDVTAVLESCTVTEQAGEIDARYLDLQFTEQTDSGVTRKTNRRPGPATGFPYTITLRKDGSYAVLDNAKALFKTNGEALTLAVIARYAYGAPSLAGFVGQAQSPKITDWGPNSRLIDHPRFKGKGGKLSVPRKPTRTERGAQVPIPALPNIPALG